MKNVEGREGQRFRKGQGKKGGRKERRERGHEYVTQDISECAWEGNEV